MKIGIGAPIEQTKEKDIIKQHLQVLGYEIIDYSDQLDVFSLSSKIAKAVYQKQIEKGIIIDDYGNIPFMVCTKFSTIICAQIADEHSAKMTRDHNNTSIISIGAKISGIEVIKNICSVFAQSEYSGGRHQIRIDMLNRM